MSEADALVRQALEAHNKGRLQEAEFLYKKALKIDPEHRYACSNLGVIYMYSYRSVEAGHLFELVLAKHPNDLGCLTKYAHSLINIGDFKKARQTFDSLAELGLGKRERAFLNHRMMTPMDWYDQGDFYKARDGSYLDFLKVIHTKRYDGYFEIGSRTGNSLTLSRSPSVSIDPFYQLGMDPVGPKDFCLLFQQTSDEFFEKSLPNFPNLRCQLAFIDGMHLFEYALRDFINLCQISTNEALFLFDDCLPWTYEMATREYERLPKRAAWTGDVWKIIPILIEAGFKNNIKLITTEPSGLLALMSPPKQIVENIKRDFDQITEEWRNVELDRTHLNTIYSSQIFTKPEQYLRYLSDIGFGDEHQSSKRQWVSH